MELAEELRRLKARLAPLEPSPRVVSRGAPPRVDAPVPPTMDAPAVAAGLLPARVGIGGATPLTQTAVASTVIPDATAATTGGTVLLNGSQAPTPLSAAQGGSTVPNGASAQRHEADADAFVAAAPTPSAEAIAGVCTRGEADHVAAVAKVAPKGTMLSGLEKSQRLLEEKLQQLKRRLDEECS